MAETRKVILFADHTAKLGGGELALLNLITHLDLSRYKPVVVLASDGPLVEKLRAHDLETHVLPLERSIVDTRKETLSLGTLMRAKQLKSCFLYAIRLAWFLRARGASLIHTNSLKSDIYGGMAGRMAGVPVLWHVRDHIDNLYLPNAAAILFRALARILPNVVVTNSLSTQRRLRVWRTNRTAVVHSGVVENSNEGHVAVVHDGFDPQAFAVDVAGPTPDRSMSGPLVVLVGRIAEWKGQHIFLRAAASVLKQYPETRFWIVGAPLFGEHEYERSLHTLCEELGIVAQVDFLGFREDVGYILAQADILVHASTLSEPFGQVVIEAMAAGKPIIATDGGALPEIVESGRTGLLVPMGSAEAMSRAITSLLADPVRAEEMGRQGRQRVLEQFTIMHTVNKVEAIYGRMLGENKPPHVSASLKAGTATTLLERTKPGASS